jgi:hypothetical protein
LPIGKLRRLLIRTRREPGSARVAVGAGQPQILEVARPAERQRNDVVDRASARTRREPTVAIPTAIAVTADEPLDRGRSPLAASEAPRHVVSIARV